MTTSKVCALNRTPDQGISIGMGEWKQVGENLVRHWGGTIYLRAKVRGKVIRQSLETCNLRAAKLKRDEKLEDLRKAESGSQGPDRMQTIGDALETVAKKVTGKRGLKVATVDYYKHAFSTLRKTLPTSAKGSSWTGAQAEKWWRSYLDNHDPRLANTVMRLVRKIGAALIAAGQLRENPTSKLESAKIGKTKVTDLPSSKVLDDLLVNVRSQRKRSSEEAAQMVEFLAWSGLRIAELQALRWEDGGERDGHPGLHRGHHSAHAGSGDRREQHGRFVLQNQC